MNAIRRWLWPPVAKAVIAVILAVPVVVLVTFVFSYVERGRRIADLELALCEERVARLSRLAMPDTRCPEADKILARVLPQRWMPIAEPPARSVARPVEWRPRQETPEVPAR